MNLGSRYVSGGCGCGGGNNTKQTTTCDTRQIQSISRVGDKVLVTFDDCTFMTALDTVLDGVSLWGADNTGNTGNTGNTDVSPTPPSGGNNVIMSLGGEVIDAAAQGGQGTQGGGKAPDQTNPAYPPEDGHEPEIEDSD